MPLNVNRVDFVARVRRHGAFGDSLPSDSDVYDIGHEALALWWSVMGEAGLAGVGRLESDVTATADQGYIAVPDAMRHVREVYRADNERPADPYSAEAYGQRETEPPLPGVWWYDYRATEGQVIELRPIPATAETITVLGTSEPPPIWTTDEDEIDLVDESIYRGLVDLTRSVLALRDDPTRLQVAKQDAERTFRAAMAYVVPQVPTDWRAWLRPR